MKKQTPIDLINRLEVIDGDGRQYTNYDINSLDFSVQDLGKTLKIFVNTSENNG